ncbi:putative nuclease HARBI1 [Chrysemys picta bellii]|uniref:putative nuclease HARBI1 n=1 Tax=Chrysemys picta bellii TaxID=8478 RepID=UPI0032B1F0DC
MATLPHRLWRRFRLHGASVPTAQARRRPRIHSLRTRQPPPESVRAPATTPSHPPRPGSGGCGARPGARPSGDTVRAKAFGPGEWAENFRLGPATFDYLCGRLRGAIQRRDTNMRRAIPAEVRLAMTLWRLGACTEYRAVEQQFGVSRSTVCKILRDVCEAVVAILTPAYVAAPAGPRAAGFPAPPQLAGVLGALHIPIRAPNENAAGYFNRRGWHSVVLQAAVDARGCFWDVNVGCPGRQTDAPTRDVGGVQVPVYLLGGPSYPLLPWLMRPYRAGELTPAQRRFNEYAAAARTVVGVAFGRLRGRWRCLQKRNDTDVSFLPTLIAACSTLHNVCEMHGDVFQPRWMVEEEEEEEEEEPFEDGEGEEGAAAEIREALALTLRD